MNVQLSECLKSKRQTKLSSGMRLKLAQELLRVIKLSEEREREGLAGVKDEPKDEPKGTNERTNERRKYQKGNSFITPFPVLRFSISMYTLYIYTYIFFNRSSVLFSNFLEYKLNLQTTLFYLFIFLNEFYLIYLFYFNFHKSLM